MQPSLSSIMYTEDEPTMDRYSKDFAAYEKSRLLLIKQKTQQQYENKAFFSKQNYLNQIRNEVQLKYENNLLILQNNNQNQQENMHNLKPNSIPRTNPITQQLVFMNDQNQFVNVDFAPKLTQIQSKKRIEGGYKDQQDANQDEKPLFQTKKQNPEMKAFMMGGNNDEKNIQHKKYTGKSCLDQCDEESKLFQTKGRQEDIARKMQSQSQDEQQLFSSKKKTELSKKIVGLSFDENDLDMQLKSRLRPVQQESYDFPLYVSGNQNQDSRTSYKQMQAKKRPDGRTGTSESLGEIQIFQNLKRCGNYYENSKDDIQLFQGKKRIENQQKDDALDEFVHMQSKKRFEGKGNFQTEQEYSIFSSKGKIIDGWQEDRNKSHFVLNDDPYYYLNN